MSWTKLTEDKATWPSGDIDVWLRDEDGNARIARCTPLPSMSQIHCTFTNCLCSTRVLKWATHWHPATPPQFEEEG